MTQYELRDRLGYVPQKGVLLSGTIDSNIRYGKPDMPEEDVKRQLRSHSLMTLLKRNRKATKHLFPREEIMYPVARSSVFPLQERLPKSRRSRFFDDSFSALDFKTDSKLRKALKEKTKDITTIIVAQRISTILNADQIIVLDDGNMARHRHPQGT